MLAPHITPFTFTIEDIYVSDQEPAKIVDGKQMKSLSCYGTFECELVSTGVNVALSTTFTVLLLAWKSPWISDGWKIFGSIIIAAMITVFGSFFWLFFNDEEDMMETQVICIKHQKRKPECVECIEQYGFYIKEYKRFVACKDHENKKPFESPKPTQTCNKCKEVKIR